MGWTGTYTHNVLIGLDALGAAVFFNRNDVTISTLCRIAQLEGTLGGDKALRALKLYDWQLGALRVLGPVLNAIKRNHCALALQHDLLRADAIESLLEAVKGGDHVD